MTREYFARELERIQQEVLDMGAMVEEAIHASIEALKNRDLEKAKEIIANDLKINQKRWDIEEQCLQVIATQQPLAKDLRFLAAVLVLITELERMGDYAEGIAKINLMMGEEPLLKPLIDIPRMAQKATDMLRRSLQAFINRDADAARGICNEDDEVDDLWNQVYRELLTFMIQDPRTINRATYLIWVAHNLERIADRVTNICERTVFLVTGRMEEMNVSKY
ncbi:MAG: phosphate signaling complex protein PhoU [Candidatus Tectomicrobia bacterium]|uniref:Phosphate-specific transport system accessory protein PhoU n=1 Tax=Tectimicrobiota bacterium TaxID=2528274 RepID=A0A932CQI0_UNCTE|nr:phosphate signaling complex protein PhoU [Candidatus Tectomicrobia bacterium]